MRTISMYVRMALATLAILVVVVDLVALSVSEARAGIHTSRLWVSDHGIVQRSTLPHCFTDDPESSDPPCTWNIGPGSDGDGHGLAYWVSRDHRTHYVWTTDPRGDGWRWVSQPLADALAEGMGRHAGTRPWERCVTIVLPVGDNTGRWVQCPDGFNRRVG